MQNSHRSTSYCSRGQDQHLQKNASIEAENAMLGARLTNEILRKRTECKPFFKSTRAHKHFR